MERYRTNFEKDDPSGQVGDVTFLGVDQYSAPENIQPGNVQAAVNVDFTTTNAQTRGGFVCLPELGATQFNNAWIGTGTEVRAINDNWQGVAYGGGVFVAVSSNTAANQVIVSQDGITWTGYAAAAANQWWDVCYGNGRFVAVAQSGAGNRVMTSPDGKTWTIRTSAANYPWTKVVYGNGIFVATAGSGGVGSFAMYSTDNGVTWTLSGIPAQTINNINGLTFGDGKFVAMGARSYVSTDGINWTQGTTNLSDVQWSVVYGNGRFVAVEGDAFSPNSAYSVDGLTWTLASVPFVAAGWDGIAFGGGKFVAISAGSQTVATSTNGINWTSQTLVSGTSWYNVAYGKDRFVAIGYTVVGYPVAYLPDTRVYASSLYSDPNAIGVTWIMLVGRSSVGFYAFGEDSRSVSLGSYTVDQQSTIVQCNNLVYLFRGPDQQPLYWDGNWSGSFQLVPLTTPAPGFETIPYSNQATYYQNRLWVVNGKDTISASDVLDFNTYDQLANEFNISTGNSDYLVATFPFGQTTLLAFKHKSILALQAVEGALTDVIVTEVTRQVGLVGINAIVSVGPDLAYVSDKNINLITLTSTNNAVQHKTLPLSSKIREIMRRVNWNYAYKISLGYLNNRLYVSLPLDNSQFCNAVVVYNFITENWYGEWNFDSSINMCIQGWQVANYLGLQRMHAITEDGRIFVTDEGQNDISGNTVAEISMSLTTRPYNANNLNHFQRRLFVDIATLRPSYSIASYTEGVNEESVLLENQTYSRSESWKFSDSAYDLTNANDDYNRAYRKDYSTGPANVQCGSGFLPENTQQIRLPLISQRNGRLSWLQITNTQGFLELLSAGFEVRPGMRGSLVQV